MTLTRSAAVVPGPHSYLGCVASAQEAVGKGANMKVSPYYSINPADPDVYHDHGDCPSGQQIPSSNKRQGTNNYPRCKHCVAMG